MSDCLATLQWIFPLYFIGLNGGYLLLNLLAMFGLPRYLHLRSLDHLPRTYRGFEPPISIIVPAYNEMTTIGATVRSLLQLDYPELEIIVVNDGSRDDTLAVMMREFALQPFPEAHWQRLPVAAVRAIYRSASHARLRVIDKENGGKADALNAGINASRNPLFCAIDADSVLQRDSLWRMVQPFLDDPRTVAVGGTVRIANGCEVTGGALTRIGLPRNLLALVQIVEYLRAMLFGRCGWSQLNAVLIISGAFGLFRRDTVVEVGGYRTTTIGEDMELVIRIHRLCKARGTPYRIQFVADPVCWTEAPESLSMLRSQRIRWQRGLAESLAANVGLMFRRDAGTVGWVAFPFMLFFEGLGPLIEAAGYAFMLIGLPLGIVEWPAFFAFLAASVGLGILLSINALLLEELTFHVYTRPRDLFKLALAVVVENVGYRQLNTWWRLIGLFRWMTGSRRQWGTITRTGNWRRALQGSASKADRS